jgi:HK97 family phage major capsid protein
MNHSIETKAATGEIGDAFDDLMTTFGTFREANDSRLAQIEKRMSADVITTDKVDRISAALDRQQRALDEMSLKRARPHLGGERGAGVALEHKHAFDTYVRAGEDRTLRDLEQKAMSYGSGQDGGYLVPSEIETAIGARLRELSPIRSIAAVRQVSGAVLKKPFAVNGPAVGWDAVRPCRAGAGADALRRGSAAGGHHPPHHAAPSRRYLPANAVSSR